MLARIYQWIDERTGVGDVWGALFIRKIPFGVNWLYSLGFATLFVFILEAITGMLLGLYYSPSPEHAYNSILYIMNEVTFGRIIRGLHHWGASAMVVLVVLHMMVVFALGAYKYPREITWVTGVFLLLVTLGFGFTGYLLPWDEKAYWATTVGTNMGGTVPFIGGFILLALQGGTELGAVTLTRFYALHTLILPALAALFITIHMYLVVKHGVTVPPWLWERGLDEERREQITERLRR